MAGIDIKAIVNDIVEKIKKDPSIATKFTKEPIKTVEKLLKIDLPDEQIENIVKLVKAKLAAKDTADTVSDIAGKLGELLGKK